MSGRIRTIKPEWLEDELMALASPEARVLSIALLLLADDYGRGRANPMILAARVFPGKIPETLAKALEELATLRFVVLYEVDGQHYFAIRNWDKHQRVDKPGKPRVPAIPQGCETLAKVPESLAKVPETLATDHDHDHDQEGEGEGEPEGDRTTTCPPDLAESFPAYEQLSEHYGVSVSGLREAAREFVGYWTVGAGMGRRKKRWVRALREDLRQKHERGRLADYERRAADSPEAKREANRKLREWQRQEDERVGRELAAKNQPGDVEALKRSVEGGWQ